MNKKLEILCVDDEPEVLEGLRMHLKQRYTVHFAGSGAEGLEKLRANKNIAVIMSDMRMPIMDGAKFLNAARTLAPHSVRMLLTGYADIQSAMSAVNEGQIFRFISKPCAPDHLLAAFDSAVTQHLLIMAEKVLLQKTLLGCVESLAKVLSVTKPAAFGRSLRLRAKARALVQLLGWEDRWQIEAAAVLSQLGAVTLSEETLMKLNDGDDIDEADRNEIAAGIDTSIKLLDEIPRMEPVLAVMTLVATAIRSNRPPPATAVEAQLFFMVLEWDRCEARGYGQQEAFQRLSETRLFDPGLLEALKGVKHGAGTRRSTRRVAPADLLPGMVLAQDLIGRNGVTILPRGFEIDAGLLEHVLTFAGQLGDADIQVYSPAEAMVGHG